MTTNSGSTASRNAWVVELQLPWCGTLSTRAIAFIFQLR
jgi:hypothetical protein